MTHKEYLTKVGIEMKVARIRKGLSARQVGELTGLGKGTIAGLERGAHDTRILTYKRIADALGVEMKDFL